MRAPIQVLMTDFLPLTSAPPAPQQTSHLWDIFCQVIDNFGDVGVCWRLASELVAHGQRVRLWMDDASALQWMAPGPVPEGLSLHAWPAHAQDLPDAIGEVVIEAFGCSLPEPWVKALGQRLSAGQPATWVNLEYLSAEDYVARCHGLPSPLMSGPASGHTRWFFYPGFTPDTGGLLRELDLAERQQRFAAQGRQDWRARHGIAQQDCAISLFCYEPPALPHWLDQWQTEAGMPTLAPAHLLVTPGRARRAVQNHWAEHPQSAGAAAALKHHWLDSCSQRQFDEMLWACDLNLVRGEDSLVRALWAGQALVWHIYPQHDNAHHDKLNAFLDWLDAPDSLRAFHHAWNGMAPPHSLPRIDRSMLAQWQACIHAARSRLGQQKDLIAQLQQFVAEKR